MQSSIVKYPDAADGQALERIRASGSDMDKPMLIEFVLAVASAEQAGKCLARLVAKGFTASKFVDDESGDISVIIPIEMIPDHREIVYFQHILDEDMAQFGARSDGWGTLGNVQSLKGDTP